MRVPFFADYLMHALCRKAGCACDVGVGLSGSSSEQDGLPEFSAGLGHLHRDSRYSSQVGLSHGKRVRHVRSGVLSKGKREPGPVFRTKRVNTWPSAPVMGRSDAPKSRVPRPRQTCHLASRWDSLACPVHPPNRRSDDPDSLIRSATCAVSGTAMTNWRLYVLIDVVKQALRRKSRKLDV